MARWPQGLIIRAGVKPLLERLQGLQFEAIAMEKQATSKEPAMTSEPCRWCKGTKIILGFAWNTYPCECVSVMQEANSLAIGMRFTSRMLGELVLLSYDGGYWKLLCACGTHLNMHESAIRRALGSGQWVPC